MGLRLNLIVAAAGMAFAATAVGDTTPNITSRVRPSTLLIDYEYTDNGGTIRPGTGSGFIVSKSGLVITAHHVIAPWQSQLETERQKHPIKAKISTMHASAPIDLVVVDWDERADVALLKLREPKPYSPLPLCYVTDLDSGTEFMAFGFPLDHEFTPFRGLIANDDGPEARWSANINFELGTSGGPVVDMDGRVIGLVKGGYGSVSSIRYVTQVVRASVILQKMGVSEDCGGKPVINAAIDRTSLTRLLDAAVGTNFDSDSEWSSLVQNQLPTIRKLQGQNVLSESQFRGLLKQMGNGTRSPEQFQEKLADLSGELKQLQGAAASTEVVTFGTKDPKAIQSSKELNASLANGNISKAANILRDTVWSWPPGAPKSIPICWENGDTYAKEKEIVREAVANSWEAHSQVRFVGWRSCQQNSRGVRILIKDDGPNTLSLGPKLDGVPNGATLNFEFEKWGGACRATKELCIRGTAVHIFGHILGFTHEQNRPDAPAECRAMRQGPDPSSTILAYGPYDPNSVMNYCNPVYNNNGVLSAGDIQKVTILYGAPSGSDFKAFLEPVKAPP